MFLEKRIDVPGDIGEGHAFGFGGRSGRERGGYRGFDLDGQVLADNHDELISGLCGGRMTCSPRECDGDGGRERERVREKDSGRMHLFVHCGPYQERGGWSEPLGYCLRRLDVRTIECDEGRMRADIRPDGNDAIEG